MSGKIWSSTFIWCTTQCSSFMPNVRMFRAGLQMRSTTFKAMILISIKGLPKKLKCSLKNVICSCKWKSISPMFYCSNSVKHELWTLSCISNESRGVYLSIYVRFIMRIYYYDKKKLHWISVLFFLGRTVITGFFFSSYNTCTCTFLAKYNHVMRYFKGST